MFSRSLHICKKESKMIFLTIFVLCFPIINAFDNETYYDEQMFLSARKFVTGVRSIKTEIFNTTIVDPSKHSDELCLTQVRIIAEALARGELWTIEIFDTWTKLQFGLFDGNLVDFGLFDKCVRFKRDMGYNGIFRGQHCMTGFRANIVDANNTSGFVPRNL